MPGADGRRLRPSGGAWGRAVALGAGRWRLRLSGSAWGAAQSRMGCTVASGAKRWLLGSGAVVLGLRGSAWGQAVAHELERFPMTVRGLSAGVADSVDAAPHVTTSWCDRALSMGHGDGPDGHRPSASRFRRASPARPPAGRHSPRKPRRLPPRRSPAAAPRRAPPPSRATAPHRPSCDPCDRPASLRQTSTKARSAAEPKRLG